MNLKQFRGSIVVLFAVASLGAASPEVPLVETAKKGDFAGLRALLQQGADVNGPAADGTTALHWAVHRDDLEAVDLLIRAGANVGATNRYGAAPLSLACLNGNAAIVRALLEAGADPNTTQPGGETALMTAARTGRVEAAQMLLARGASVTSRDTWKGQTALMWAAAENNSDVVQALIDAGAEIHARSSTSPGPTPYDQADRGFTPLLFAARANAIDAARTLIAAGANVNDKLVTSDAFNGTSALVLAVIGAKLDIAAFLLEHGADPNAADQGWTALHQMAWTRRINRGLNTIGPVPRGQIDTLTLVEKLVAHGADVNARITRTVPQVITGRNALYQIGATPLFAAAHRVDVPLMRLLLASGADPLIPNDEGTTPLMAAAGVGIFTQGETPGTVEEATEAVKLCLERGADPTTADVLGETALHGAAYRDAPAIIEMLAKAGAKVDAINKNGLTPLTIADGMEGPWRDAQGKSRGSGGGYRISPAAAALLRRLLQERGLPVPPQPTGLRESNGGIQ